MDKKKLYQCAECGLHYEDETIAKKCEVFCKENNACNLEITQSSVERNENYLIKNTDKPK